MKKYTALLTISLCFLAFFLGRKTNRVNVISNPRQDTLYVVKIDTVVREKVIAKNIYKNRIIKDTLFSTDTVRVEVFVPISNYIYEDSLYRAEISGYNVSLDRMEIFQKTTEKTVHIPFPVKNNKRWGLGISAGYAITPKGFQSYVGVGVQYNIIMW